MRAEHPRRLNTGQRLRHLRTTYKVRAPKRYSHPLIRAARDVVQIPVVFHNCPIRLFKNGGAPDDVLYEEGTMFVGKNGHDTLLHEFCHAMVAHEHGKLGFVNFASNQEEEELACRIEFWLGFVSGYLSYEKLCHDLLEYNFEDALDFRADAYERRWGDHKAHTLLQKRSVRQFLLESREKALEIPQVRAVAEMLGVDSKKAFHQRWREAS